MMSHIEELKAFKGWKMLNEIPTSSVALWHTLNAVKLTSGSESTFGASNSLLEALTGLSRQGLVNARDKLLDLNLIRYEKKKKGKDPTYEIYVNSIDQNVNSVDKHNLHVNSVDHLLDKSLDKKVNSVDKNRVSSYMQLDSKIASRIEGGSLGMNRPETNVWQDITESWEEVFGRKIKSNNVDLISAYIDQDGMSESLILEAIERTHKSNKKVISYLQRILNDWSKAEIKTIGDLVEYDKSHSDNLESPSTGQKKDNVTKIQEWFDKSVGNDK